MRRLELVEGASSKFWEIELQGSAFTVRWGRIGTAGQTQQKSFANEAKAQAEHDKLLAEKLKKGYAEVGSSAATSAPVVAAVPKPAAPAAAPKPPAPAPPAPVAAPKPPAPVAAAPARPEAEDTRPIAWSEELVKRVHPRRGGITVSVRTLAEPAKAWGVARNAYSKMEGLIERGMQGGGELAGAVGAVVARLKKKEPSIGTPEEDAVLLALLQHRQRWGDKGFNVEPLIDLLFSLGGPVHATQAVLSGVALHVAHMQATTFVVMRGMDPSDSNSLNWNLRGLPRLRALLASFADEAAYAAARDAAAQLRSEDAQRSAAAFLFPTETAWVQDEARAFVKDQRFDGIICSISDRDSLALVAPHLTLRGLVHAGQDYLPTLLDGVGVDAMVLLRELRTKLWNAETRQAWAEALSVINTDEALALLLEVQHEKEVLALATEAALRWPRRGLRAIAPKAAVRGKAGDTPRAMLTAIIRRAPQVVAKELAGFPPEVRKVIADIQEQAGPDVPEVPQLRVPAVFRQASSSWKPPAFFDAQALPAPLLADRKEKLPVSAVTALGAVLSTLAYPERPPSDVRWVKEVCDRESLTRFAWALFEAWMMGGAPTKESWAFKALGVFGDDACARKLVPLIRQWPGESAHQRAVLGLDVLAAIGTDVTLIYLNGIAEKVKFKALQQRAKRKIAELAEARGLTREELADRLVPDLGLDENGSLQLDFGERTFTVGFDEQLKPYVKDAEGARLKDLPKPTKKDDAAKAEAAAEQWKALKKDAKAAASIQVLRLELGMCAKRRWSAEAFQQLFVQHPLLIHIVRRLVWGTYDSQGKLLATFRVAEDRSLADRNDDAWELSGGWRIGIPHPLELEPQVAAAWGQVFADYQLLQPFPQLGRPTYTPTPEEQTVAECKRVQGLKVPTGKVLGLETRGWRRGPPQDAGVVCWMERPFDDGSIVMLDLDPGLYTGYLGDSPEQTLGIATLRSSRSWGKEGHIPLGKLDPILFSELARDLEGLRP
jgi:predicted DNA-binding WGR domain protein